jgi:hypothetical protein
VKPHGFSVTFALQWANQDGGGATGPTLKKRSWWSAQLNAKEQRQEPPQRSGLPETLFSYLMVSFAANSH